MNTPLTMDGKKIFPVSVDNSVVVHLTGLTVRMTPSGVQNALAEHGTVHAMWKKPSIFEGFTKPFSGLAAARFTVAEKGGLPHKLNVAGEPVDVWYVGKPKYCVHCNAVGHLKKRCPDIQCYVCNEKGHLSRACPKRAPRVPPKAKKAQAKREEKKKKRETAKENRLPQQPAPQPEQSAPEKDVSATAPQEEGWQLVSSKKKKAKKAKIEVPTKPDKKANAGKSKKIPRREIIRECSVALERVEAPVASSAAEIPPVASVDAAANELAPSVQTEGEPCDARDASEPDLAFEKAVEGLEAEFTGRENPVRKAVRRPAAATGTEPEDSDPEAGKTSPSAEAPPRKTGRKSQKPRRRIPPREEGSEPAGEGEIPSVGTEGETFPRPEGTPMEEGVEGSDAPLGCAASEDPDFMEAEQEPDSPPSQVDLDPESPADMEEGPQVRDGPPSLVDPEPPAPMEEGDQAPPAPDPPPVPPR